MKWPKYQKLSLPDYLLLLLLLLLCSLKTGCIGVKMNIKYHTLQILRHHKVYHTHTHTHNARDINIYVQRKIVTHSVTCKHIFSCKYIYLFICCSFAVLQPSLTLSLSQPYLFWQVVCNSVYAAKFSLVQYLPHFTHLFTSVENVR